MAKTAERLGEQLDKDIVHVASIASAHVDEGEGDSSVFVAPSEARMWGDYIEGLVRPKAPWEKDLEDQRMDTVGSRPPSWVTGEIVSPLEESGGTKRYLG